MKPTAAMISVGHEVIHRHLVHLKIKELCSAKLMRVMHSGVLLYLNGNEGKHRLCIKFI